MDKPWVRKNKDGKYYMLYGDIPEHPNMDVAESEDMITWKKRRSLFQKIY